MTTTRHGEDSLPLAPIWFCQRCGAMRTNTQSWRKTSQTCLAINIDGSRQQLRHQTFMLQSCPKCYKSSFSGPPFVSSAYDEFAIIGRKLKQRIFNSYIIQSIWIFCPSLVAFVWCEISHCCNENWKNISCSNFFAKFWKKHWETFNHIWVRILISAGKLLRDIRHPKELCRCHCMVLHTT